MRILTPNPGKRIGIDLSPALQHCIALTKFDLSVNVLLEVVVDCTLIFLPGCGMDRRPVPHRCLTKLAKEPT
jgi:hypothetical protein